MMYVVVVIIEPIYGYEWRTMGEVAEPLGWKYPVCMDVERKKNLERKKKLLVGVINRGDEATRASLVVDELRELLKYVRTYVQEKAKKNRV